MSNKSMQSVERLFMVVEKLAQNEYMGVRELKQEIDVNTTTVHRILSTLVQLGYARQDDISEKYALTYKFAALGNAFLSRNSLVHILHPYLKKLSNACAQTVHLVERANCNIRYIDKITPAAGVFSTRSYIGLELPLTCTAVGKAILSALPESEWQKIWQQRPKKIYTKNTITNYNKLKSVLEKVRKTGIAYDNEENEEGLFCVAANLADYTGEYKYAISISAPISSMSGSNLQFIEKKLLAAKKEISPVIGSLTN